MCKPKANELVRFAEVPPCFGKLNKLFLKFNFLLISRAIARLNILSFHSRVNCYIVPKIKDDVAYGDGMDWFPSPVVPATALAALVPQAGTTGYPEVTFQVIIAR